VGRITFQKGPHFIVETASKLIPFILTCDVSLPAVAIYCNTHFMKVAARNWAIFSFTRFPSHEKIKDCLPSSRVDFLCLRYLSHLVYLCRAVMQGTAYVYFSTRSCVAEILTHSLTLILGPICVQLYARPILKYPNLKRAVDAIAKRHRESYLDKTVEKSLVFIHLTV